MQLNLSYTSNSSYEECQPYNPFNSLSLKVIFTIIFSFSLLAALAGNALLITVFFKRYDQLRSPVTCFIVNMAVSDLFVPLFVFPRRIQQIYLGGASWLVDGVLGDMLCRMVNFADEVSVAVSMQSMVIIAMERWWSIVFPMKSALISQRLTPRFVAFTWIFAVLFFLYYLFAYKLGYKNGKPFCEYSLPQFFDTWEDLWRVDRIILLVVFVIVPFFVLTICYTAIAWSLCHQGKRNQNLGSGAEKKRMRENRRITLMLVAVVVVFLISWTPHCLYFFQQYFPSTNKAPCNTLHLYLFARFINYLYTVINPVIYYIFSANYRREFREVFCVSSNNRIKPRI